MIAHPLARRLVSFAGYVAAIAGFLLVVDSLLALLTLVCLVVLGRHFSPYATLALALFIPGAGLVGALLCWAGWRVIDAQRPDRLEDPAHAGS